MKEDFPEWAGPVEAEFAAMRAELAKAKQQPVDVDAIKASLKSELKAEVKTEMAFEAVEEAHAGWRNTVRTPEFAGWLKSQPADVQARAASDRPKDAITLLDGFKAHKEQADKAAADAEAERLRKEKRLSGAVTPRGTSAPATTGIDDDAAFERGFKKVRAKA